MTGRYTVGLTDFDGDTKQVSFPIESPASDGSDLTAWNANINSFRDAVNAISAGRFNIDGRTATYERFDLGNATSPLAQDAIRLILQYQDTVTTKTYQDLNIPMPDMSLVGAWTVTNGLTTLVLSSGVGATLKTQFEANVLSPAGNAVELLNAYIEE